MGNIEKPHSVERPCGVWRASRAAQNHSTYSHKHEDRLSSSLFLIMERCVCGDPSGYATLGHKDSKCIAARWARRQGTRVCIFEMIRLVFDKAAPLRDRMGYGSHVSAWTGSYGFELQQHSETVVERMDD